MSTQPMRAIAAAVAAGCLATAALGQMHKCTDSAGRVTFTERACDISTKSAQRVDIPLSTDQSAAQRRTALDEGKARAASDRTEAISLMLQSGRVNEARAMARTPSERALVNDYAAAQRQQQRDAENAESSRRAREAHEKLMKKLRR